MKLNPKSSKAGSKIVGKDEKYDSVKYWIENGIDLEKRRVMLDEDVDEFSTGFIFRGIMTMKDMDASSPIDIIINSYGGTVYDGLKLYDLLRSLDDMGLTIRTYGTGKIMSMGLILFLAGSERQASENATFMAHSVSGGTWGKCRDMEVDTEETKRLNKLIVDIIAERTELDYNWWHKHIRHEDRYYDREKAIELGIVNEYE